MFVEHSDHRATPRPCEVVTRPVHGFLLCARTSTTAAPREKPTSPPRPTARDRVQGIVGDPQIAPAPASHDTLHYGAERSLMLSLFGHARSEEHTSELQSLAYLV